MTNYADLVSASIVNPDIHPESFERDGKKYVFSYLTGGTSGCAVYEETEILRDKEQLVEDNRTWKPTTLLERIAKWLKV